MSNQLYGEVTRRIQEIIRRQLQGRLSSPEEAFANDTPILGKGLGLDSLEALVLSTQIEAEFDILIEDDDLTESLFESIGTLAEHVVQKLSAGENQKV